MIEAFGFGPPGPPEGWKGGAPVEDGEEEVSKPQPASSQQTSTRKRGTRRLESHDRVRGVGSSHVTGHAAEHHAPAGRRRVYSRWCAAIKGEREVDWACGGANMIA